MPRLPSFDSPFLLGFDHLERLLDAAAKNADDGYPPYDVEQRDENTLRITLAVAGFTSDDLDLTLEDNQLVIHGRRAESEEERIYLHHGIAARQFQRKFVLAEGMDVAGASLENGLLHIDLVRPEPERTAKKINIGGSAAKPAAKK